MDLNTFLIKLLITIGVIWLVQVILGDLPVGQPASKIIFWIVLIVMIFWLLVGGGY